MHGRPYIPTTRVVLLIDALHTDPNGDKVKFYLTAIRMQTGNKGFILEFLQHASARVSVAEWTKELKERR
jgi:hypothetical protein